MTDTADLPTADRLRFRRYRPSDLTSVMEMFADDEAKRWYPTAAAPAEAAQWIEWNLGSYDEHGVGLWVIEDRSTGTFLGDCGLTYQLVEDEYALEVGYHLQSQHRGNGYAIEGATACVRHAQEVLGSRFVCLIVDPHNRLSNKVAAAVHRSMRPVLSANGNPRNLYFSI